MNITHPFIFGVTLAMLIIAAFQLQALRQGAWHRVPAYALGGGMSLTLMAITLWVMSTL